eukprot:COSAG06_NODE_33421_length_490_cov_0.820972_1_plen_65_part_01
MLARAGQEIKRLERRSEELQAHAHTTRARFQSAVLVHSRLQATANVAEARERARGPSGGSRHRRH